MYLALPLFDPTSGLEPLLTSSSKLWPPSRLCFLLSSVARAFRIARASEPPFSWLRVLPRRLVPAYCDRFLNSSQVSSLALAPSLSCPSTGIGTLSLCHPSLQGGRGAVFASPCSCKPALGCRQCWPVQFVAFGIIGERPHPKIGPTSIGPQRHWVPVLTFYFYFGIKRKI